ncbi:IKI3 family-domain-containing protein [Blyttiomyces helicus]|uniref:IKI3 family-domain-containing protein n=1 Tax=Blyttiomyces helicus TaxID=388810 RepID=A0A4P9W4N8_9FUNG|nr:IKI3 family-domain-containing protein [Blyttiomyces helicus]|eukprot:RKO86225.1 IKI3 family-domain-containing protein [Blyttiomyces helicus]
MAHQTQKSPKKTAAEHGAEAAESALKYVIFLADVDKLYDFALGMYDFSLVLMVAQHSQKDPREYLPFLSSLQKLEKHYQRFRIDDHLGRHEKALGHLSLAGEQYYRDCMAYVKTHFLYKAAVRIFEGDESKRRDALTLYADYLVERSEFENAGLLYLMASARSSAMDAYRKGGVWRQAFAIAAEDGVAADIVAEMAEEMAEEFAEARLFADAARVLIDYGKNPVAAVKMFVRGSLWADATRVAHMSGHSDLLESTVKPGIMDGSTQLMDDVREMTATFDKQRARLREVRIRNAKKAADGDGGPIDDTLDNIDMFSDTSSMATTRITGASSSQASRTTNRTSRTSSKIRRKAERKRAAGKDPAFEEEFLVNNMRKIVTKSNDFRGDVQCLIRALLANSQVERARALQQAVGALVAQIRDGLQEVFGTPVMPQETREEFRKRTLEGLPPPAPPAGAVDIPVLSTTPWGVPMLD